MPEKTPFSNRLVRWTRVALIAAIAVVGTLLLSTSRHEYPLTMSRAQAEALGATPGYLMTTIAAANNADLYLFDSQKQTICVYSMNGNQLRLTGVRKIDADSDIHDGGKTYGNLRIEGNKHGLSVEDAKKYLEFYKKENPKD